MKTKKIIALLFFAGLYQSNSIAQGLYFELNSGYSLSSVSQNMGTNSTATMNNDTFNSEQQNIIGSFGKGFEIGMKVGYKISENIGFDLKADYLAGANYDYENSFSSVYSFEGETYLSSESTKGVMKATMWRVNPAMVFELSQNKLKPYARLGLVIGMGRINAEFTDSYSESYAGFGEEYSSSSVAETKAVLKDGLSFGTSAEVGIQIGLSEKLSFLAGIKAIGMSFAPKKGEITSYIFNGEQMVSELNTSQRENDFVNEMSSNDSGPSDPTKPAQELKTFYGFSSIGLSLGLRFSL